ncbi:MAG: DUF59 domain-containing protein, partial [Bacteroidia bacterium]|nr:DUF59 domain-containing protein [Bacteroidia bacterium]
MTQQDILQALSHVQEPDLRKDLVSLGMVKDIVIEKSAVSFTIVLTTPACPLKELIRRDCENAIHEYFDASVAVLIKFTANTSTNRHDGQMLLAKVKNIIAVVSGKGGVGKTSVAAATGLRCAELGYKT